MKGRLNFLAKGTFNFLKVYIIGKECHYTQLDEKKIEKQNKHNKKKEKEKEKKNGKNKSCRSFCSNIQILL